MSNLHRHIIGLGGVKGVKKNSIHTIMKRSINVSFQAIAYHHAFGFVGTGQVNRVFKYGLIWFINTHIFGHDNVLKISPEIGTRNF